MNPEERDQMIREILILASEYGGAQVQTQPVKGGTVLTLWMRRELTQVERDSIGAVIGNRPGLQVTILEPEPANAINLDEWRPRGPFDPRLN